jgi:hypothetical protein
LLTREKENTVFAVEPVTVADECSTHVYMTDGIQLRVSAVTHVPDSEPLETGQILPATAVEAPTRACFLRWRNR